MPAKTILTLLFLASLGVVAIVGLRALPRHPDADPSANNEMLVASAALAPGTLLRAKDVAWQRVTGPVKTGLILRPRGAGGSLSHELDQQAQAEVFGAALRTSVEPGEPIARQDIV